MKAHSTWRFLGLVVLAAILFPALPLPSVPATVGPYFEPAAGGEVI